MPDGRALTGLTARTEGALSTDDAASACGSATIALVKVKAQGLLQGTAWVRETHGEATLRNVLSSCSAAVRERCTIAEPTDWIPDTELAEFLGVADRALGHGDGRIAEELGAASARANLRNFTLRLAFFLANPEFLMRRVAGVWRQYNDAGAMHVREFTPGRMSAELVGVPEPDWFICCSVTGWLREAGVTTGMKELTSEHAECRSRGRERCLWSLRWNALGSVPPVNGSRP